MTRRGIMLAVVMLLTALMLVLALGYLGTQGPEARRGADALEAAQAYELARAGIEDARAKFLNDLEFPPFSDDQRIFSYSEEAPGGGTYRVTIDCSRAEANLFEVRSESWRGRARRTVTAWVQGTGFQVVRWNE